MKQQWNKKMDAQIGPGGQSGFTLIEVMVAVVVVGILTAIALPAYSEFIKRAARGEARAILMENAQGMEQLFTLNNSYNNPPPTLKFPASPKSGTVKYNISIDAGLTATTYRLKAVPAQTENKCGTYLIDNTGLRSNEGNSLPVAECWGG
jgi:type IV pilus assembly protein PilE